MAEEDLNSSDLSSDIAECKTRRRGLKDKVVALNEEMQNIEREGDKLKKLKYGSSDDATPAVCPSACSGRAFAGSAFPALWPSACSDRRAFATLLW
jgi:hypothetical protein